MAFNNQAESSTSDHFAFDAVIREVDSIIAKSLTNITHSDREQSYLKVHGISNEFEETPDAVEKALTEMQSQIEKITNKEAFELAESLDANYVKDPSFRLKFLRGERFDVPSTAEKFVRHFELKKELFGESKLVKDIEQEDLNERDIKALYSGFSQWLPLRDIRGRIVHVYFPTVVLSSVSKLKVFFYMRMVAIEDVGFQKKGNVVVLSTGDSESSDQNTYSLRAQAREITRMTNALPGSTQCVHSCIPNLSSISSFHLFSFASSVIASSDRLMAVRFRIHKGSSKEDSLSKLQAFGIPVSVIPNSPSDNDYHGILMQRRKRLELRRRQRRQQERNADGSANEDFEEVLVHDSDSDDDGFRVSFDPLDEKCKWICTGPSPKDVILGRGQPINSHAGNIRLRTMVEEARDAYRTRSKMEKKRITQQIVGAIQTNGRFLKESEMFGWVEVPDEVARIKVSHAFRDSYKVRRNQSGGSDKRSTQTMVGKKHELEGRRRM